MFRVPADAVDMRVPREYVLPRGWQAYAIVTLIPLWWIIGASFFMWALIALPLLGRSPSEAASALRAGSGSGSSSSSG